MALSEHQVIEALRPVTDPELHVSIVELDMIRRVDGSGFAPTPSADGENGETDLMAQLSPRQQEVVRAVSENPDLSEVEKMWGITEALFNADVQRG